MTLTCLPSGWTFKSKQYLLVNFIDLFVLTKQMLWTKKYTYKKKSHPVFFGGGMNLSLTGYYSLFPMHFVAHCHRSDNHSEFQYKKKMNK